MQTSLTKKLGLSVAALAMVATSLFTASDAEAVPAFARQTGMSCNSCHFQSFPALNGMGRSFRAGNYTMKGAQTAIEGENMDLPSTMGMSAVWKTYHIKEASDDVGTIAWPDEAAFLVGGRLAANAGYLWEIGLNEGSEGEDTDGDGQVDSVEGGTSFLSTKVAFTAMQSGSMTFSVIPYSTDALGSAYGFELMNTAAQRSQRAIEKRDAMSAASDFGIGAGAATGIAFALSDLSAGWWANLSLWGPGFGEGHGDLTSMANHLRVGYFFDLAGFDSGVAFMNRSGGYLAAKDFTVAVGGTVLDFQMQGQVGGNDLGIYFSYAAATDTGTDVIFVDGMTMSSDGKTMYADGTTTKGAAGTGLTFKYSVTPKVQAHFANTTWVGGWDQADTMKRTSVGVDYKVAENISLQLFQYNYNEYVEVTDATTGVTTDELKDKSKLYMGWFFGL